MTTTFEAWAEQTSLAPRYQVEGPAVVFLLKLARALHRYGLPSHRLEENLNALSQRLETEGQFFCTPTSVIASFGADDRQRTFFIRATSGDANLEKLDALVRLSAAVAEGRMTAEEGIIETERIVERPQRYGFWLTALCFAGTSGGAARLFGGGWREATAASLIGLCVGLLLQLAGRRKAAVDLTAPVAAIGAIVLAEAAALVWGDYAHQMAALTGLIVLLPGLTLTVAMTELSTGHSMSGTARLANAGILFLMIGFGLALGGEIDRFFPRAIAAAAAQPLPDWTIWLALAVVALSLVVLFRAHPRDTGWVCAAGLFSFVCARTGSHLLGAQLGGFLAAFALGMGSNSFTRLLKRPSAIIHLPGLMLLVPGSVGFRSMTSLIARDTVTGLETAFDMALTAIALVAGLLLANLALPPRGE